MADKQPDRITLFNTLFTNNHICMLKILLPLLPPSLQGNIAVYIKFQELQYTMQHFHNLINQQGLFPKELASCNKMDINSLYEDMLPYCTKAEKQTFTQMRNMYQSFQNMKDMMEMIETMKELFPEGFDFAVSDDSDSNASCGLNPQMFAGLSNMFGGGNMDISQMTDLFQAFQGN